MRVRIAKEMITRTRIVKIKISKTMLKFIRRHSYPSKRPASKTAKHFSSF